MQNEEDMKHKRSVLVDLVSKMKEMSAQSLQNDHGNSGNSVNDHEGSLKAREPANEEESEDKSEQSHMSREDGMHDSSNGDKKLPKSSPSPDSEAVSDKHGGNASEPAYSFHNKVKGSDDVSDEHGGNASEPSDEESNEDEGAMDREDSMHDDESPIHPALAKLIAEHMKRK